jgi:hypothetical protein
MSKFPTTIKNTIPSTKKIIHAEIQPSGVPKKLLKSLVAIVKLADIMMPLL